MQKKEFLKAESRAEIEYLIAFGLAGIAIVGIVLSPWILTLLAPSGVVFLDARKWDNRAKDLFKRDTLPHVD